MRLFDFRRGRLVGVTDRVATPGMPACRNPINGDTIKNGAPA
jgi:hypothetical protein